MFTALHESLAAPSLSINTTAFRMLPQTLALAATCTKAKADYNYIRESNDKPIRTWGCDRRWILGWYCGEYHKVPTNDTAWSLCMWGSLAWKSTMCCKNIILLRQGCPSQKYNHISSENLQYLFRGWLFPWPVPVKQGETEAHIYHGSLQAKWENRVKIKLVTSPHKFTSVMAIH